MSSDFSAQVAGVGALAEPIRRALYLYVAAQPEPVSRDEAATGTELPRHTAKFHLDKLVAEGLLETEFRRLSGRQGPGAGRPAKLYRRSSRQLSVSVPERHYELVGRILARALEQVGHGQDVVDSVQRAATDAGREMAGTAEPAAAQQARKGLQSVVDRLAAHGYEPRIVDETVVLANCPFHDLAREHTELVCGMNRHAVAALLDELGHDDLAAVLDPAPGRCCVTIAARR